MRRLTHIILPLLALLGLAATSGAPAADANKVLVTSFRTAETGFDGVKRDDKYSGMVAENIFDPMFRYEYLKRPAKLVPNTIEAMPEAGNNGRTFTFRIRKGIYFAPDPAFKGQKRELTAADYAYTVRRFYDPKVAPSPWLWIFEGKILGADELRAQAKKTGKYDYDAPIEGLQVLDRYTLRIRLKETDYNFLYILAMPSTGAQAREVIEAYPSDTDAHPVGTGPFMLEEWSRAHKIVLVRNPNYREEIFDEEPGDDAHDLEVVAALKGKRLPVVDRVEIYPIDESQPRFLAFMNKEHDYIEEVPAEFINRVMPNGKLAPNLEKMGVKAWRTADQELTYNSFNMNHPVVGGYTPEKVALRRAMNLAYNTSEEIQVIRKGMAIPAQSPIGPGVAGYDANFRSSVNEYDPAKAKALLDMFGYIDRDGDGWRENPDGSRLEIEYAQDSGSYDKRLLAELWKKSMDKIGINLRIKFAPFADNLKAAKLGVLQMRGQAWHADYPDAENFLQLLYGPNSGQSNDSFFKLPEYDRLYEQSRRLPDGPERDKIYAEMIRLVLVYAPWNLGVHRLWVHLAHPWVSGFKRHPTHNAPYKYIDVDLAKRAASR